MQKHKKHASKGNKDVSPTKALPLKKKTTNNTTNIKDNLNLPPNIIPTVDKINTGQPSKYTPELAKKILEELATDSLRTVDKICENNGINKDTMHMWKLYIPAFSDAYYRAKSSRADTDVEELDRELQDLADIIRDDGEMDAREKHVRIQLFHRMMQHKHWTASKLSDKYRDTPGVQINIDASGMRAAAWDHWQEERSKK